MSKKQLAESALVSHLTVYEMVDNVHPYNNLDAWIDWRETLIYLCNEFDRLRNQEAEFAAERDRRADTAKSADTSKSDSVSVF